MVVRVLSSQFAFVPTSGHTTWSQTSGVRVAPVVCRPRLLPSGDLRRARRRSSQLNAQMSDDSYSSTSATNTKDSAEEVSAGVFSSPPSVDLDPEVIKEKALRAVEDVSARPGFYGTIAGYAVGALVLITVLKAVVVAVDSLPVLPGFLELVGLGYCGWFAWRFVIFKSSRQELLEEIDELLGRTTGRSDD
jgi:hypothetical protein